MQRSFAVVVLLCSLAQCIHVYLRPSIRRILHFRVIAASCIWNEMFEQNRGKLTVLVLYSPLTRSSVPVYCSPQSQSHGSQDRLGQLGSDCRIPVHVIFEDAPMLFIGYVRI